MVCPACVAPAVAFGWPFVLARFRKRPFLAGAITLVGASATVATVYYYWTGVLSFGAPRDPGEGTQPLDTPDAPAAVTDARIHPAGSQNVTAGAGGACKNCH
eukprot:Opistho-2@83311